MDDGDTSEWGNEAASQPWSVQHSPRDSMDTQGLLVADLHAPLKVLEDSLPPADPCPEPPVAWQFEDAANLARLECRLEDWMQSVDRRLDKLLEVQGSKKESVISNVATKEAPVPRRPLGKVDFHEVEHEVFPAARMEAKSTSRLFEAAEAVVKHRVSRLSSSTARASRMSAYGSPPSPAPATKMATKWKKEIDGMRRLSAYRAEKDNLQNLRGADLHKIFWIRHDAVERARQNANGRCTLETIVLSDWFDYFISLVLLLNGFLIGFEAEWTARGQGKSIVIDFMDWLCAFIFAAELGMRIVGRGRDLFCTPGERSWAVCDVILVTFSIIDFIFQFIPGRAPELREPVAEMGASGRLLKIMRMLRIMRLLRMVRFLSELRVMAHMIQHSLMSLFWLFTLLSIVIYIFSIVLTQGTTDYLRTYGEDDLLRFRYGSLFQTMYTLFQAMTGGVSWGDVTTPLLKVGVFYFCISLIFVFFSIFSVLNIVTGVFVDGAIELAKQDRFMVVARNVASRDASAMHLLELLREMDQNGDDTLTADEFSESLKRTDISDYLEALSVDATEAELLFMLLDKDGDGCVDIEEFVAGMQRLQGEAKSFDVHLLMHAFSRSRFMMEAFGNMAEDCGGTINVLGKEITSKPKQNGDGNPNGQLRANSLPSIDDERAACL